MVSILHNSIITVFGFFIPALSSVKGKSASRNKQRMQSSSEGGGSCGAGGKQGRYDKSFVEHNETLLEFMQSSLA